MALPLEICVLGELEVRRGGEAQPLPASKKTRALLGYLVVARGRPQPRRRLCELLWDGPDDPRAALRWSLTKIRPLIDDPDASRLVADREHVVFQPRGAAIDLATVADGLGPPASAALEALQRAAALHRGELLEGLDLPDCYRFHEWCVAEREAARRVRAAILEALVERLDDQPEAALPYARERIAIDPLAEAAHIAVMRLLAQLGRPREAIKQYESCRRILDAQLGRAPSKELEVARSALGQVRASAPPMRASAPVQTDENDVLVGRGPEQAIIADALRDADRGACRGVLLFAGEPGIGKTRLLGELVEQAASRSAKAICGRAFEAEMIRPYGVWIDALRSDALGVADDALRSALAPLFPEVGVPRGEADRGRLFGAVGQLLLRAAGAATLVVALDDIQWLDEASAALLHYVARTLSGSRVLLACAARAAEIDGNPRTKAALRALSREGRLLRRDLPALDAAATEALVHGVDGGLDAARIFIDAGGNPLFSLELARAIARGESAAATHTLDGLLAERLSRLDGRAADLLPWAAALGHSFTVDTLAALTSLPACELMTAVEELERRGVLRVTSSATGSVGYDFAHDLVRRAAYRAMSEPRRRWVHLHVARTLAATNDAEDALAGDVAHHAALAGDSELAARACLAAGERCLRLFAYADATRLAGSGLQHVDRLPLETGLRLRLALLAVQVHSNQWLRRPNELEAELSRVATLARQRGMHAEASRSYYLMSFVHNERGDFVKARARTLEAARAVRSADNETRQLQLANTGHCLALIERDLARANDFLREAAALGPATTGRTRLEIVCGAGLIKAFDGEDEEAVTLLEQAAELAVVESDHWTRAQALTRIARIALERGRPAEALARCVALGPLVAKLSEGSEAPFVFALSALSRVALGQPESESAVERALESLRAVDSKGHVAYVLNTMAAGDARAGRFDDANHRAREALRAAETVGQQSEAVVARACLALLATARGDRAEASALVEACHQGMTGRLALSARARAAVTAATRAVGVAIPDSVSTTAPTPAPTTRAHPLLAAGNDPAKGARR